jgi:hypothetical protein
MRIVKKLILRLAVLLLLANIVTSCNKKYRVESAAIDSLLNKNQRAMSYLKIDLITINERKIEMDSQISILVKFKPDSSAVEFEMNLEKYKGINKIYSRFIANYDVIFNKIRMNERQLSGLKNSLMDEKISGYDFKLALNKETERVNITLADAETFGHKIYQLEPDYQRLSGYFDPLVGEALKKYPELRSQ